jgi:hypothetical protein
MNPSLPSPAAAPRARIRDRFPRSAHPSGSHPAPGVLQRKTLLLVAVAAALALATAAACGGGGGGGGSAAVTWDDARWDQFNWQ